MSLTTFQIRTLLRAEAGDLSIPAPNCPVPTATATAALQLMGKGLTTADCKITPRGRAYIEMLCATPLPVERTEWIDPRNPLWAPPPPCTICGRPGCPIESHNGR